MTDHQIVYFLSGADNNSVKTEDCFFKKVGIPGRERLSEMTAVAVLVRLSHMSYICLINIRFQKNKIKQNFNCC
ncbi:hypothetical protein [Chryseobacterium taeanense]|uniref:hypothetical protein n=1 Tax=Chryseobacterium taeanense TaxID=311334 RepID=UPI000B7E8E99|nr:hypothetical protein [Chryseobacterium taeanense]